MPVADREVDVAVGEHSSINKRRTFMKRRR